MRRSCLCGHQNPTFDRPAPEVLEDQSDLGTPQGQEALADPQGREDPLATNPQARHPQDRSGQSVRWVPADPRARSGRWARGRKDQSDPQDPEGPQGRDRSDPADRKAQAGPRARARSDLSGQWDR